jgi:hypothetical protein
MSTILEGNETERDDDEKNGFLVYMPPKQKRRVATKCYGTDECVPTRPQKELYEGDGLEEEG